MQNTTDRFKSTAVSRRESQYFKHIVSNEILILISVSDDEKIIKF